MKILYFLLLSSICFGQLLPQIDNQIFHFKGDLGVTVTGAGVSEWLDQSGQGNDATQGTDADRPNYVSSSYLDFDDSNTEFLTLGDDNAFSFVGSPFSIVMYINLDDATNARLVGKGSDTDPNIEYFFGTNPSDFLAFSCYDATSGNNITALSDVELTAYQGSWIMVAGTYDGGSIETGLVLYVNGLPFASTNTETGTYVAMHNTGAELLLGQLEFATSYYDGKMQESPMTSDVITPTEMSNLYTYFTTGVYPGDQNGFPGYSIYPRNGGYK